MAVSKHSTLNHGFHPALEGVNDASSFHELNNNLSHCQETGCTGGILPMLACLEDQGMWKEHLTLRNKPVTLQHVSLRRRHTSFRLTNRKRGQHSSFRLRWESNMPLHNISVEHLQSGTCSEVPLTRNSRLLGTTSRSNSIIGIELVRQTPKRNTMRRLVWQTNANI